MLMAFFPERATEIQVARLQESLSVSRRAKPTRRVAFPVERSAD